MDSTYTYFYFRTGLTGYQYTVLLDGQRVEPDYILEPLTQDIKPLLPDGVKIYEDIMKYRYMRTLYDPYDEHKQLYDCNECPLKVLYSLQMPFM